MAQIPLWALSIYGGVLLVLLGIVGWLIKRQISKYDETDKKLICDMAELCKRFDRVLEALFIVTEALVVLCHGDEIPECAKVKQLAEKLRREVLHV